MKSYTLLFLSFQVVEAIINVQTAYAGDAANGMRVFNTYCSDCHSITEGKIKLVPHFGMSWEESLPALATLTIQMLCVRMT